MRVFLELRDLDVSGIRGTKQLAMGMGIFLMELSWRWIAEAMTSIGRYVFLLKVTSCARSAPSRSFVPFFM